MRKNGSGNDWRDVKVRHCLSRIKLLASARTLESIEKIEENLGIRTTINNHLVAAEADRLFPGCCTWRLYIGYPKHQG